MAKTYESSLDKVKNAIIGFLSDSTYDRGQQLEYLSQLQQIIHEQIDELTLGKPRTSNKPTSAPVKKTDPGKTWRILCAASACVGIISVLMGDIPTFLMMSIAVILTAAVDVILTEIKDLKK